MVRKAVFVVLMAGLAASAASAADISLYAADLSGTGWNTVVVPDSGGRGSVTDRTWGKKADGVTDELVMQFTNGDKDKTARCWAAISTDNYAGVAASQITSLKIRVYGIEGDGTAWSPPTFLFAFARSPSSLSNRFAEWIPWADGTPRAPGAWMEYDAMTDGQWSIPWIGGSYSTFADMVAAYPEMYFANDTEVQAMMAGFAGHSFSVGHFDWINNVNTYHDSARGVVDWFEVGIDGDVTKFYLSEVPEPATIGMLLLGLPLLRRRR